MSQWHERRVALFEIAGFAVLGWLGFRMLQPFLAAIAWAFGLALAAQPLHARLRKYLGPNGAAALTLAAVILVLLVPAWLLVGVLVSEIRDEARDLTLVGPAWIWLNNRFETWVDMAEVVKTLVSRLSGVVTALVAGSAWVMTQIGVMLVLLFYFLRDGARIVRLLIGFLPFEPEPTERVFDRIGVTIRTSLLGKVAVSSLQGLCGGLMFWWLGLPAPAFWGLVMAVLSVIPVMGAFVIWAPAAAALAVQGDWKRAVILTIWGILIIHPIDNVLGPVLVGSTLRLHTLVMFFAVIGGLAAFGGAGVVVGPVVAALVVALAGYAAPNDAGVAPAQGAKE